MLRKNHLRYAFYFFLSLATKSSGYRTWTCLENKCVKSETSDTTKILSLGECKATCLEFGGLWPKPTGVVRLANTSSFVDLGLVSFNRNEFPKHIEDLIGAMQDNFLRRIKDEDNVVDYASVDFLYPIQINLEVYDPSVQYFETGTDESYVLQITPPTDSNKVNMKVVANTIFGLRHGLETLSQLFFYDEIQGVYKVLNNAYIEDKPVFTHRGIVLDTARSYITVDNLIKLIDAMAANKMNTFHWHITDSQSFPYVSEAYPELSKHGAYSKNKVYTQEDIKNIVSYAQKRGVRVLPEFDAPAHVGEGWEALGKDLVTCFKWEPWTSYCVEPPCGQFDPTNEKVYQILATIFKEYVSLFNSDLFHMGGDEVNLNCWRSTPRIVEWMKKNDYPLTNSGFIRLWGEYQEKVLKKLRETKTDPHPQAILWTSTLTENENLNKFLKPEDYIVQIWTTKLDQTIKNLILKKYRIIFSNYDELYFDCGGPSWVQEPGQNWCSPYIGWQYVYQHSPYNILKNQGINVTEEVKKLVLGSEAAIWTEQIDNNNVHIRLWPRAAALAESLWSNPNTSWKAAQFRMNHHRERLSKIVPTELLQPEWCYQNDGFCK